MWPSCTEVLPLSPLSKLFNPLSRLQRVLSGCCWSLCAGGSVALCASGMHFAGNAARCSDTSCLAFPPFFLTRNYKWMKEMRSWRRERFLQSGSPLLSPPNRCRAEVRGARSERCLAGHGERRSGGAPAGGGRRGRRRRLGAGGGPAAGRSAVGLHRAGRPGARWAAHHLQGTVFHMSCMI